MCTPNVPKLFYMQLLVELESFLNMDIDVSFDLRHFETKEFFFLGSLNFSYPYLLVHIIILCFTIGHPLIVVSQTNNQEIAHLYIQRIDYCINKIYSPIPPNDDFMLQH